MGCHRGTRSSGLSPQWTLEVSEQIQESRAFFLPLQLKILQVFRLILKVKVSLLLPLLLPLQIQKSEQVTLLQKPLPVPVTVPVQVVLPRKKTPVTVQEPHPAFLCWSGF